MLRSLLVAIFVAATLACGAIANAQSTIAWNGVASSGSWTGPQIHQSSMQPQTPSHKTAPSSKFGAQHNGTHHGLQPHRNHHHRNAHAPWWSRSVYINAGTAADYLATPTPGPKPTPKKNNVTQPGVEVFKSIGN